MNLFHQTPARPATWRTASRMALGFALGSLFTLANAQVNVTGDTGIDASGDYQRERAWCMANTSGEAQVDCLRNSGAAQAEKRRGTLDNNGGNFRANAVERCEVFNGEEQAACQARVMGMGSVSGSVQGGGMLRQVETFVVPAGQSSVTIEPQTSKPLLVVPLERR